MKITDARNNSIKLGKFNKILNRSEFYKFDLVVSGPCQQITQTAFLRLFCLDNEII